MDGFMRSGQQLYNLGKYEDAAQSYAHAAQMALQESKLSTAAFAPCIKTAAASAETPDLQRARTYLEFAEKIVEANAKEWALKRAEVFSQTGYISRKEGDFQASLKEYQAAHLIKAEHLEASSKELASSHYDLALAYQLDQQFFNAKQHASQAKNILKQLVRDPNNAYLKKPLDAVSETMEEIDGSLEQ